MQYMRKLQYIFILIFTMFFLTQSRSQFSNENHWLLLQIRKDFSIAVPTKESCKILSN